MLGVWPPLLGFALRLHGPPEFYVTRQWPGDSAGLDAPPDSCLRQRERSA
jgi:hypothetical protein